MPSVFKEQSEGGRQWGEASGCRTLQVPGKTCGFSSGQMESRGGCSIRAPRSDLGSSRTLLAAVWTKTVGQGQKQEMGQLQAAATIRERQDVAWAREGVYEELRMRRFKDDAKVFLPRNWKVGVHVF